MQAGVRGRDAQLHRTQQAAAQSTALMLAGWAGLAGWLCRLQP